uniref:Uncharacterized protein n=1 Tax=Leersia perrieri TaxID=77586 RepID=A0A0D9WWY8_9ORYZ
MIYRVLAGVIHTVPPLGEILHLEEGEIDEQTEMVHAEVSCSSDCFCYKPRDWETIDISACIFSRKL